MPAKSAAKRRRPGKTSSGAKKKWSAHVTQTTDALDLEKNVFTSGSAEHIAASLKRSAGKNLPETRKRTLEVARDKLRELYHQDKE